MAHIAIFGMSRQQLQKRQQLESGADPSTNTVSVG